MGTKDNNGFWLSISDLMSGLMVIFLFISVAYMREIKEVINSVIHITEEFVGIEQSLYEKLMEEFKYDLIDWNAEINKETISFIFKEPEVLFEKGEFKLKPKFIEILKDFFPRYVYILHGNEFKDAITSIRIEGHTSSEWKPDTPERDAYIFNLWLSQMRSSSVLEFVLSKHLNGSFQWVRDRLQAVGHSSSKLKYDSQGIEDRDLSRRVEFRVVTNDKERLLELVSLTAKDKGS
jgi:outer membrane protein OmpA-like peptidoglycan-associated protein